MLVDSNRFSCALIRPYGTGIVAQCSPRSLREVADDVLWATD